MSGLQWKTVGASKEVGSSGSSKDFPSCDPAWRSGTGGFTLRMSRGVDATKQRYSSVYQDFAIWAGRNRVLTGSTAELDLALGEYIQELHSGHIQGTKQKARDLIAAVKQLRPEVSRFGDEET